MGLILTVAEPLFLAVLSLEALDAPGGIDELLLAGEERVACRTNFQADFLLRGTSFELVPAGATHLHFMVLRMYLLLHIALTKTFIIAKPPRIQALNFNPPLRFRQSYEKPSHEWHE
jgi:hypothetical protein